MASSGILSQNGKFGPDDGRVEKEVLAGFRCYIMTALIKFEKRVGARQAEESETFVLLQEYQVATCEQVIVIGLYYTVTRREMQVLFPLPTSS